MLLLYRLLFLVMELCYQLPSGQDAGVVRVVLGTKVCFMPTFHEANITITPSLNRGPSPGAKI